MLRTGCVPVVPAAGAGRTSGIRKRGRCGSREIRSDALLLSTGCPGDGTKPRRPTHFFPHLRLQALSRYTPLRTAQMSRPVRVVTHFFSHLDACADDMEVTAYRCNVRGVPAVVTSAPRQAHPEYCEVDRFLPATAATATGLAAAAERFSSQEGSQRCCVVRCHDAQ